MRIDVQYSLKAGTAHGAPEMGHPSRQREQRSGREARRGRQVLEAAVWARESEVRHGVSGSRATRPVEERSGEEASDRCCQGKAWSAAEGVVVVLLLIVLVAVAVVVAGVMMLTDCVGWGEDEMQQKREEREWRRGESRGKREKGCEGVEEEWSAVESGGEEKGVWRRVSGRGRGDGEEEEWEGEEVREEEGEDGEEERGKPMERRGQWERWRAVREGWAGRWERAVQARLAESRRGKARRRGAEALVMLLPHTDRWRKWTSDWRSGGREAAVG
ncbi:unnamed protein product [Closterium sp. NIES-53]